MKQEEIENWKSECESFQQWFSNLGGNIGNNEQMSEAFRRIEAKNVSDNKLYQLLENEKVTFRIEPNTLQMMCKRTSDKEYN
jgi:hypothetical protein